VSWRTRLQGLLAREREELADEVRRAVRVLLDLHDVGEGLVLRAVPEEEKIAEADHRGEESVEVVRDAAGELADELHLLRLEELVLEALLLGDVEEVDDEAGALLGRGLEAPGRKRRDGLAVGPEADLEGGRRRARMRRLGDPRLDARGIVTGERRDERGPDQRRFGAPRHAGERRVAGDDRGRAIEEHDADRRILEEAAEALLGEARLVGGDLLGGPVADQTVGDRDPVVGGAEKALIDDRLHRRAGGTAEMGLGAALLDAEREGARRIGERGHDVGEAEAADELARVAAEPAGQHRIDVQEAAGAVDRIGADTRGADEGGDARLLGVAGGIEARERRGIGEGPDRLARPPRERTDGERDRAPIGAVAGDDMLGRERLIGPGKRREVVARNIEGGREPVDDGAGTRNARAPGRVGDDHLARAIDGRDRVVEGIERGRHERAVAAGRFGAPGEEPDGKPARPERNQPDRFDHSTLSPGARLLRDYREIARIT